MCASYYLLTLAAHAYGCFAQLYSATRFQSTPLTFLYSLHLCVTAKQIGKAQEFLHDLRDAVADVRVDPSQYKDSSAALYGVAATLPDRSIVRNLATTVLDVMLEP